MGKEKKAFSSNFTNRKTFNKRERNYFLSGGKKLETFKDYMNEPRKKYIHDIERSFIDTDTGEEKTEKIRTIESGSFRFECNQPLQVRVFGNIDEARELVNKIRSVLGYKLGYDRFKKISTLTTTDIGVDKVECDKNQRYGNYCSDAVRVYFNLEPTESRSCTVERL